MTDVLGFDQRIGPRTLVGSSFSILVLAGTLNTSLTATPRPILAATLAGVGVVGLAVFARSLERAALARTTLHLWLLFVAVGLAHVVSLDTMAVRLVDGSLPPSTVSTLWWGVTWATLIGAAATTAFLGFREYGSRRVTTAPEEQVLDSDLDL